MSIKVTGNEILAVLAEKNGPVPVNDLHTGLRARLKIANPAPGGDISYSDIHLKLKRLEQNGLVGMRQDPGVRGRRPVLSVWIEPKGREEIGRETGGNA